jgi:hypothetical protein
VGDVEYDERQHFTKPRAMALGLYLQDVVVGFDRAEWIAHDNKIAAKDDDPPYRDEQRAFYDSVRDLLVPLNGYRVVRLKHGARDWRMSDVESFFPHSAVHIGPGIGKRFSFGAAGTGRTGSRRATQRR